MTTTQIYKEATGEAERARNRADKLPQSPAEDAVILQQRVDWLQHPCTIALMKGLLEEASKCDAVAREQAIGFKATVGKDGQMVIVNNTEIITKQLVISATLRRIVEDYGRPN